MQIRKSYSCQLAKHKFFETQLEFLNPEFECSLFDFQISLRRRCDHEGFNFRLELFEIFFFDFSIYDHRHWDYEKNAYCTSYDEIMYK